MCVYILKKYRGLSQFNVRGTQEGKKGGIFSRYILGEENGVSTKLWGAQQ